MWTSGSSDCALKPKPEPLSPSPERLNPMNGGGGDRLSVPRSGGTSLDVTSVVYRLI